MTVHTEPTQPAPRASTAAPLTVVVIDRELPKGLAANAAAVLALTLGARRPALVGSDFEDGSGAIHPGLIPVGLPVLGASASALPVIRQAARERDLVVVDFPSQGQQTTDYDEFRAAIAATQPADLGYLAILISGPKKAVRAITGQLGLLR